MIPHRFIRLGVVLLLTLLFPTMGWGRINRNGDFQLWSYLSVEKELKEPWSSRLIGVMRWGDGASRLYFSYGQWQLAYKRKYIEIAPGYRQEYFRPEKQWFARYNPLMDITFFLPSKSDWLWEDRSRMVYNIPQNRPSLFIYRNRVRLTSPPIDACFNLRFFIDDEVFFHQGSGFAQNRLSIGLVGDPTSYLKGRIYYMYRNLKRGDHWTYQNVVAFHIYF